MQCNTIFFPPQIPYYKQDTSLRKSSYFCCKHFLIRQYQ